MFIFYRGGHGNSEDDDWYSEENDFQHHIICKGKGWHLSPGLGTPETILSNTVYYCPPQRDCALTENRSSNRNSFQTLTSVHTWWVDRLALWKNSMEPASAEYCRNLLQPRSSQRPHDWTLVGIKVCSNQAQDGGRSQTLPHEAIPCLSRAFLA